MPTTTQLVTEVREAAPGVVEIRIAGEINAMCEGPLMAAFTEATDYKPGAVVLDFGGLEYMNSGGIGLLVTLLIRAQRQSVVLMAYGLTTHYRQIFELTRIDEAIGIYESLEAAVAAASPRRGRL